MPIREYNPINNLRPAGLLKFYPQESYSAHMKLDHVRETRSSQSNQKILHTYRKIASI